MLTQTAAALVTDLETFYLQNGAIQFQPVGTQSINIQGNYGIPANVTNIFRIINGTDQICKFVRLCCVTYG